MVKIPLLPQQTVPTIADKIPISVGGTTYYELMSSIIALFFNNIPAGAHSDVTRHADIFFDHVASGCVWAGDSYASTRNASMSAGVVYINGRRISISSVSARSFTASRDTYIDVLDNLDGTGTLVYTEVTNNAASPSLAANSIRIGIIVTGASNIAAVGSVNQGQENKVLPIASSIAYTTTDSLGNLICSRDPNRKILGYKQLTSNLTTASTTVIQAIGLSCPVIVPAGRKVKISAFCVAVDQSTANAASSWSIYDGVVGVGTSLGQSNARANSTNGVFQYIEATTTPSSTNKTYNLGWLVSGGTGTFNAAAIYPAWFKVELV